MKLSTRSRYACRALISLAQAGGESRPIPIKKISLAQDISHDYLVQLFGLLKSGGLVKSERGASGGIMLARPAGEITLADIIELTEGSMTFVACLDNQEKCRRFSCCAAREVWGELKETFRKVLKKWTVADLAAREKSIKQTPMYYI